ncbi:MAG: hypothetical protein V1870_04260 [Candidatus Aenigmatarchaeota archaeon]
MNRGRGKGHGMSDAEANVRADLKCFADEINDYVSHVFVYEAAASEEIDYENRFGIRSGYFDGGTIKAFEESYYKPREAKRDVVKMSFQDKAGLISYPLRQKIHMGDYYKELVHKPDMFLDCVMEFLIDAAFLRDVDVQSDGFLSMLEYNNGMRIDTDAYDARRRELFDQGKLPRQSIKEYTIYRMFKRLGMSLYDQEAMKRCMMQDGCYKQIKSTGQRVDMLKRDMDTLGQKTDCGVVAEHLSDAMLSYFYDVYRDNKGFAVLGKKGILNEGHFW